VFAGRARREPRQRTVRANSTHPLLAIPRGTLPIELAMCADRLPRQARCSQQRDQSSSQHETTQHCTSRIAIYSLSGGLAAVSVPSAPRCPLPLPHADRGSEWSLAIFVASTAGNQCRRLRVALWCVGRVGIRSGSERIATDVP